MSKNSKKKKTKYNQQQYASFNPKYQVGNRRSLLTDIDYLDKLNDEEKEWLNRFLQETVVTNFNHGGETLIDDPEKRRALYRENNARNRDMYNLYRAKGVFLNDKESDDFRPDMDDRLQVYKGVDVSKAEQENWMTTLLFIKKKLEDR